jgi:hypothetical protein
VSISDFYQKSLFIIQMSIRNRTGNRNRLGSSNRDLGWFTNRHALIRRFTEYVNSDSPAEQILYFYGAGGNGKSLLLDFLRYFCCKRFSLQVWGELQGKSDVAFADAMSQESDWHYDAIPAVYQDFGERGGDNRPKDGFYGVLQLRRNLGKAAAALDYQLRFPLFDFACLWYLHEKEKLTPERLRELFPADALDVVTETVNLFKEVPGVGLAKALFGVFNRRLGEQWTIFRAKIGLDEAEVQRLQKLDPDRELFYEFPDLLARDLNGAMAGENAPPRVALLLDTHESFWDEKRNYQGDRFFYQDEWLRRFLRELELADGIIAVVAGRELPRWQEAAKFDIPQDCIESQLVGDFSLGDALAYLQKAQIEGEDLQQAILNYASSAPNQVHPFLLALCVDVVETASSRGETLTPEDFSSQAEAEKKPQILIDRLLHYVDRQVAYAVHALSACRSFDFATYRYLGGQLDFQATQPDFEILTGFSFVREIDPPLIPPTGGKVDTGTASNIGTPSPGG